MSTPERGIPRRDLESVLAQAENAIALLARCRPENAVPERARLIAAWRRGAPRNPDWRYSFADGVASLQRALVNVAEGASSEVGWERLYAERAWELSLEAAVVEALGTPRASSAAARRFPVETGEHGRTAEAWARSWVSEAPGPSCEQLVRSDDAADPQSLLSAMHRAVGEARLPFRVVQSSRLPCAAATGDGVIVVRAGASYTPTEVARVVLHEIRGHALPRMRARNEVHGLFSVGTAGGPDDEEGRALLLEERAGFFDARRRAQLGRRHLAALSVREGATWVETTRLLLSLGTELDEAVDIASRAHRGGGLARELVYLVALSRVRRAFDADPECESWLERGRVSAAAVAELRQLGAPPALIFCPKAA